MLRLKNLKSAHVNRVYQFNELDFLFLMTIVHVRKDLGRLNKHENIDYFHMNRLFIHKDITIYF